MSYLPLIDLKNGFWPVVHLLYGISEWNFTDMLIIKGYILWLRIVTLTFPDCELSTLDWSENWFWPVVSFTIWNIWMKLHRYVEHQRLHIFSKDRHPYLSSSWVICPWLIWKWFLTCSSFTIWSIWMKLHRYVDHQRLHIVGKDRHSYPFQIVSYPPLIDLRIGFWPVVHFIRPCSLFPIDNLSIYAQKFFKFCIHIVIGDEWYGIVNGQNPTIFDGVTALSPFKKWFLACYSLLFMISEWNFTDMLNSKGYILQRRTVTLSFPVHELSALD